MATISKNLFLFLGLFLLINLNGCNKNDGCDAELSLNVDQAQLEEDIAYIDAYLAEQGIQAQTHPSGLRYVINSAGSGKTPTLCNQVSVAYEGTLLSNGSRFDRTGTPRTFSLNGLILGWQIGIPLIKSTGNIDLYIPSVYGYGSRGSSSIPPDANLKFEITLVSVN